ncbi:hypothetical protein CSC62_04300 [Pseudoxanthomonas jiangsuensis]|uniref:hypothetical protein n=1 Tax=Pseudoxanthomonas jiangsuensis TaxID=619688 RepID=UPI00139133E3|nr:hypothetical protein [Pseudoxanthomonas jiangsuensis]KAF1698773.1 hypothetical protein CSC62_04300 [Pseudoxanthomonas jiangsuensis]
MSSRSHRRRASPAFFLAAVRRRWPWLLLAAAVLATMLVLFRQPLAGWLWPANRIDLLLAEGDRALAEGRLDRADGQGARQKFEAALALDGDRREAREGLARVGLAALQQAREAIARRQWEPARRQLALAEVLEVPRAQLEAERARLRRAEAAGTDLEALRARAQAALAANSPEEALPLFARWLSLQPEDTAALEGREDALSMLLQRAQQALQAQDLAAAARWIAQVRSYDPGHVELPDVQSGFAQALDTELRGAGRDLARGRLDAATARLLALRAAAAEEPAVAAAAQRAAEAQAAHALRLSADFHFDAAERALAQARDLAPDAAAVVAAGPELARDREAARLREKEAGTPQAAARLRRSLQEMEAAWQRGAWIAPPGASAYDHLRTAQALAPDDPRVAAAARRLQARARDCVEASLRGNRLGQAQECHDAWQALAPRDPDLAAVRQRLAQRWLAVGEERLRAGELEVAARALASARRLDPRAEGLEAFAERLERARSSR